MMTIMGDNDADEVVHFAIGQFHFHAVALGITRLISQVLAIKNRVERVRSTD
jgi:hypothetical protein